MGGTTAWCCWSQANPACVARVSRVLLSAIVLLHRYLRRLTGTDVPTVAVPSRGTPEMVQESRQRPTMCVRSRDEDLRRTPDEGVRSHHHGTPRDHRQPARASDPAQHRRG